MNAYSALSEEWRRLRPLCLGAHEPKPHQPLNPTSSSDIQEFDATLLVPGTTSRRAAMQLMNAA